MASIRLQTVSKAYGSDLYGVKDVDLTIEDGEFICFLGPSGCGKSTTLRMIAGLEDVTDGAIWIGDKDMTRAAPRDRNVAVVFQSYALYPHMSVRQNMEFGLKMRGVSLAQRNDRIDTVSEILGLGPYLDRKPAALSGGQRQRVALGRAMVREPDVFLMDEPLSNLDAKLRAEMRLELIKLHRRLGRTTIFVTHDQVEAMTMGDRICIMRDGHLVQVGKPLEVYANPVDTFVAQFLASPAMNLLDARLEKGLQDEEVVATALGHFPLSADQVSAYDAARGRKLLLGLRPEDIHEADAPGRVAFKAEIVAVEALGTENIVVFNVAGQEFTARLGRHFIPAIGSTVPLYGDPRQMHLFDAETTRAYPRPSSGPVSNKED
ncbi:carbohydrate ABC transporter ATP-binding protein (CUT1 family) [Breoghania corrubedonensis]|uniref:Carbohydrate ABC transporter ATP-binding protein (CUT1 family) n=1 Tax=Breoghania corrubedonensis TaxID=665038 RepID=A0A2T5V8Y7_9HYPH|nr:sn-glycerol-3-phosphate ABC transporter ATP-binding protein UgpC [Breoghania corrubedonensis]PTW60225.1 carbohydrate ABC transporter ATP-binding protein (CUT1 family) [Breoghania corrubedonensis]